MHNASVECEVCGRPVAAAGYVMETPVRARVVRRALGVGEVNRQITCPRPNPSACERPCARVRWVGGGGSPVQGRPRRQAGHQALLQALRGAVGRCSSRTSFAHFTDQHPPPPNTCTHLFTLAGSLGFGRTPSLLLRTEQTSTRTAAQGHDETRALCDQQ